MASRPSPSRPLLLLLLSALSLCASQPIAPVGSDRTPIKNVAKNQKIQDLGRWAVDEFNREITDHPPDAPPSVSNAPASAPSWPYKMTFESVVQAGFLGAQYTMKIHTTNAPEYHHTFYAQVVLTGKLKRINKDGTLKKGMSLRLQYFSPVDPDDGGPP